MAVLVVPNPTRPLWPQEARHDTSGLSLRIEYKLRTGKFALYEGFVWFERLVWFELFIVWFEWLMWFEGIVRLEGSAWFDHEGFVWFVSCLNVGLTCQEFVWLKQLCYLKDLCDLKWFERFSVIHFGFQFDTLYLIGWYIEKEHWINHYSYDRVQMTKVHARHTNISSTELESVMPAANRYDLIQPDCSLCLYWSPALVNSKTGIGENCKSKAVSTSVA